MGKKLIISERQLVVITKHIEYENSRVINEGFNELALGMMSLAGAKLTGQNQAIAQKTLDNPKTLKQVQDIIVDAEQLYNFIEKVKDIIPSGVKYLEKLLPETEE
jgi:thymidine phosphorylase